MIQRLLAIASFAAAPALVQEGQPPLTAPASSKDQQNYLLRKKLIDPSTRGGPNVEQLNKLFGALKTQRASGRPIRLENYPGRGACSIPLTEIKPPSSSGTIVVIEPRNPAPTMPEVRVPAPPCPRR